MRHPTFRSALVTGGAGFIGSHLVDALTAAGCRVTVVDNLSSGSRANLAHLEERIAFVEADIRDRRAMLRAAEAAEVVFHLAAVVAVQATVADPVETAQVNDMGTLQVLDAARLQKCRRVVLASSCALYGDGPELPKHEALPPSPLSPYAAQKLSNEIYAGLFFRLYGLETVCLRYFNVYGPRQDPSSPYSGVVSIFIQNALSRRRPVIYGDGGQTRDFVFVGDVARANLLAAAAPRAAGGVFNIGTGEAVRIDRLWRAIANESGCGSAPRLLPPRAGDVRHSCADIGRAAEVLGFTPGVTRGEGLRQTIRWCSRTAAGGGRAGGAMSKGNHAD